MQTPPNQQDANKEKESYFKKFPHDYSIFECIAIYNQLCYKTWF